MVWRPLVPFAPPLRSCGSIGVQLAVCLVQCVLVMACALGVAEPEAEGISQERSQSFNALKNRRYSKSTFSAGASSPMMDWMISSPSRVARASLLLPCAQQ